MLEKPNLADEKIITCLQESYALPNPSIAFQPIGADNNAWAYYVRDGHGKPYFLKVRRGIINEPSLTIPHYLLSCGIEEVVAPIPALNQTLWQELGLFRLMLYPFVNGRTAHTATLSHDQWHELGTILQRIHATQLPPTLHAQMPQESFQSKWLPLAHTIAANIENHDVDDPFAVELAQFWREKQAEIEKLMERVASLAHLCQQNPFEFVLCHADFHAYNVMMAENGRLFIVDWDETVLAPKERDLMFSDGAAIGTRYSQQEQDSFLAGYGTTDINPIALAYYRYEWAIADLASFSERILFNPDNGAKTKAEAMYFIRGLFHPHSIAASAYQTEQNLPSHIWLPFHQP